MLEQQLVSLSRFLALVLRHQGPQMGLQFDEQGFTEMKGLVGLLKQNEIFSWAGQNDITMILQGDLKGRYELKGDRIRARYGHSGAIKIKYEPAEPPSRLYHGTTGQSIVEIQRDGLKPQTRQFVHLSVDEETAFQVGRRRVVHPVILEIDAAAAHKDGIEFYHPTNHIFLVREIPAKYLSVRETKRGGGTRGRTRQGFRSSR